MPLLLYLSHAGDPQRFAIGPTLAGLAERAGWEFDCYYSARRLGRHFGGGDPSETKPGGAAGSLVGGGRHADQVLWLAARHELVALGDPLSPLWPALRAAGAEELSASSEPAALYRAAHDRLGQELPSRGVVLDASPQGRHALVVPPYLYPTLLAGPPSLAIVTPTGATPHGLASLGVTDTVVLPAGERGDTYSSLTARLAGEHRDWDAASCSATPSSWPPSCRRRAACASCPSTVSRRRRYCRPRTTWSTARAPCTAVNTTTTTSSGSQSSAARFSCSIPTRPSTAPVLRRRSPERSPPPSRQTSSSSTGPPRAVSSRRCCSGAAWPARSTASRGSST